VLTLKLIYLISGLGAAGLFVYLGYALILAAGAMCGPQGPYRTRKPTMYDLIFLGTTLVFFGATALFIVALNKI